MIILILLILLQLSFSLHIFFLIQYVIKRSAVHLRWFINTAISNMVMAGGLTVLAVYKPSLIRTLDLTLMMWLVSGFVMFMMLLIKITIIRNILKRCKDPANFHLNYFGKKVLHPTVVQQSDVLLFFMTMPFFLMAGAYFVARLLNYILYGHL